ncbi:hypothetical protein H0H93_013479 [Arthromyces matolae]|nr:hypothetical protein H0H93_013479 [Arthromyces matolae]
MSEIARLPSPWSDHSHDVQLTSDPERDVQELSDLLRQARGATSLDELPTIEKFHLELHRFREDAKPYRPMPNSRMKRHKQRKPMPPPASLISTQNKLEELLDVVLQSLKAMEARVASGSSSGKQPASPTQPEISKVITEWETEKTRFYKDERVSSSPSTE